MILMSRHFAPLGALSKEFASYAIIISYNRFPPNRRRTHIFALEGTV